MDKQSTFLLRNGVLIPRVAFGTYRITESNTRRIMKDAIQAGYRYFDTASKYRTESLVGSGIRQSGIAREQFFIATKIWKTEMGYENTLRAYRDSLDRIQTDYLDLYLIHWPKPTVDHMDWKQLNQDTWRAMEDLYEAGKIRAIGVCNYLPHHMEALLEHCRIKPMVNQLELHPGYMQFAAISYFKEQDIRLQAWSPLGRMRIFKESLIQELSEKYGVSPARLCLRYLLQKEIIPIPKSSHYERMRENLNLYSFEISKEDEYRIDSIPQTGWSGEHPDRENAAEII